MGMIERLRGLGKGSQGKVRSVSGKKDKRHDQQIKIASPEGHLEYENTGSYNQSEVRKPHSDIGKELPKEELQAGYGC